jgi:hypothetical protein
MPAAMDVAISWGIWAWITTWWLALLVGLLGGPLMVLPVLNFIVVTVAMVIISSALFRHRLWLWPG